MAERDKKIDDATLAILILFVQFGDEPTESDRKWADTNLKQNTPDAQRARRYALAALRCG